ncbi:hypothetical protein [Erythrobacter sp.]|uniref:hypothetical protein n=1 Tax=Erythrobacter sp. TaxID=1042 RepID=UPI0025DE7BA5|nr:hypothetical protein [Erythrobacter sp.]
MIKAVIIVAAIAILVAVYLTDARLAPPVGAALLLIAMLYGWIVNRRASRANLRKAEEATHRQREERAHDTR